MKSLAFAIATLCIPMLAEAQSPTPALDKPRSVAETLQHSQFLSGHRILVQAFLRIRLEDDTLCDDTKSHGKSCIWFTFDSGTLNSEADLRRYRAQKAYWLQFSGQRITVRGKFYAGSGGHLGTSAGELWEPELVAK